MRTYKRKTSRGSASLQQLSDAAKAVMNKRKSVNAAAKEFNVKRMTLTRYISKLKSNDDASPSTGYKVPRQVFSEEQEHFLKEYLLLMAFVFYRYSHKDIRFLAYVFANKYKIRIPAAWSTNKMAGKDWLAKFLKRNTDIPIKKSISSSLDEESNAENLKVFFDKLTDAMDKCTASQLWNIDKIQNQQSEKNRVKLIATASTSLSEIT